MIRHLRGVALLLLAVGVAGCAAPTPQPTPTPPLMASVSCLRAEYRAVTDDGIAPEAAAMEEIRSIVEDRIASYGVSEAVIATEGSDRIVVVVPEVETDAELRRLIGSTGKLELIGVPIERSSEVAVGSEIAADLDPLIGGGDIESATAGTSSTGLLAIDLTFSDEGAQALETYTRNHVGGMLAIVLDGVVLHAPQIGGPLSEQVQVVGDFTQSDVQALVTFVRHGPLPNPVEEISFDREPCP